VISGGAWTNRFAKRKAILGQAGRALRAWPAGKKFVTLVGKVYQ